ncbi:hypothetical protein BDA96_08G014300 [Sorghum bicolor]|uniref:Uncharacterized protein n=2 Tax=Sorghum bicolor TaxID=4558 RepID=A0A1B6PAP7_SORBI|nr:keratin, type I cytoskeletal 9-like [Sorghum bicolor]KAG0519759.1 hypothetical protein BDA96_08G014300 [Sorghum bicolor]KXG22824.1 hypothetical protein SORBI_3008G013100 [Sorghum bicolor]OQU78627.1 hypothetical protein SORBI_3008G013100 [Sorghum bicolor]|eukprot:XP_021302224.1 keratin, type I cytoskeletal 9-like [Sorghum bicolor]
MVAWNRSSDVNGDREDSGSTSHPPLALPRPDDNGDNNVHPVPLWEREFCRNAYDIPWETFCENKRFIGLYRNVMDWDDSGALENFEEAKERFRAQYFGEVGPNNGNNNFHGGGSSSNLHQQVVDPGHTSSGTGRMLTGGGTMWMSGAFTGGATKWNGGGGSGNGTGRNWNVGSGNGTGRNWNVGSGGGGDNGNGNGSGRNRNGGGGGSGSSSNWNCFGRGNYRSQREGQHQQRNGGGIHRNQDDLQHRMRSGGRQQQGQGRMKEWRPVQHNRAPKDDPAA